MGRPPLDMIIVGAAKAGTTSLLRYLSQHPEVCAHRGPEMGFFVVERQYAAGYAKAFDHYFGACSDPSSVLGKNAGLMYRPQGFVRLRDHNPAIDVVALLRDPVARAYSHFWFARQLGYESLPSFEAALDAEADRMASDPNKWYRCAYVSRSDYATHLEPAFELFPRAQIHIITTTELDQDPQRVCRSLFEALGVSPDHPVAIEERHNVTGRARSSMVAKAIQPRSKMARAARVLVPRPLRPRLYWFLRHANLEEFRRPEMDPMTRARLAEQFAPMVARLEALTGRSFDGWRQPA